LIRTSIKSLQSIYCLSCISCIFIYAKISFSSYALWKQYRSDCSTVWPVYSERVCATKNVNYNADQLHPNWINYGFYIDSEHKFDQKRGLTVSGLTINGLGCRVNKHLIWLYKNTFLLHTLTLVSMSERRLFSNRAQ